MECVWDCLAKILGFDYSGAPDNSGVKTSFERNVRFDDALKGKDVKVSKDGCSVSGNGTCMVKTALHQDKVYWEITVVETGEGKFRLGVCKVAGIKDDLQALDDLLGDDRMADVSWALKSDQCTTLFAGGDTIGISYDQISGRPQVDFYLNGDKLPGCSISGLSGVVCPAVSVTYGVELKGNFSVEDVDFEFLPPAGFSGIIPSRSMI
uniref:SPRY domain-containing protein n=1 Tax=Aplanochytrium stocchinoi TaxID=215587 RepID=A0A7S3LPW5_9STRA|mmetsp:Transcript_21042/g.25573  ORF Transcript_21042/g.25573 Transcript_21042/m.25573 type:complete len:208 (-) Transcript_21042:214-837(-)|eukprot:CAMPEP_0204822892 /NCGR_PEP_ID=MMETSP1346-20131115/1080_1 /ASSEMBLY_ACC=CAM_ASM_000771 /TAXON_ID=215587 /ORGANISM="Aplanochytrium stocchinoi, Strain GSBS06" /LENGTH=207 /DNA_ID=CAMNT_0051949359 /DNA_START=213 /DNA_END=836 /DNA_ORIENTATION=+